MATLLLIAAATQTQAADPFTQGNIILTNHSTVWNQPDLLYEYTPGGTLVRQWAIANDGPYASDSNRGVIVDYAGNAQLWVNIWDTTLRQFNPTNAATFDRDYGGGWGVANVTGYGDLAAYDHFIFAASQQNVAGAAPGGIIRFDLVENTSQKFLDTPLLITDLFMGHNNYLYSLGPATSPGNRDVDWFDPMTLAHLGNVRLPVAVSGIAVGTDGHIFGVANSTLYEFDIDGSVLNSLAGVGATDIDLAEDGNIVLVHGRRVYVTDVSLASYTTFIQLRDAEYAFGGWVRPPVGLVERADDFVTVFPSNLSAVPAPSALAAGLILTPVLCLRNRRRRWIRPARIRRPLEPSTPCR